MCTNANDHDRRNIFLDVIVWDANALSNTLIGKVKLPVQMYDSGAIEERYFQLFDKNGRWRLFLVAFSAAPPSLRALSRFAARRKPRSPARPKSSLLPPPIVDGGFVRALRCCR